MRKMNGFMKKLLAVSTAGVLTVSAAGTVWAADTYQSVEQGAISSLAQELADGLAKDIEEMETLQNGGYDADLTLKLGDGGKLLLGQLTSMDFSWFDTLSMLMKVSVQEGIEAVNADLLVNDGKLCSMQVFMDMAQGIEYVQIPELVEGYLKASFAAVDSTGVEATEDSLKIMANLYDDPTAVLPESGTVKELLERYGNILVSHMQEGASGEEAVSVGDVSENCTVYEGQMYEADFLAVAEEVLTTAKDDAQIKEVLDNWSALSEEPADLYAQFQEAVDNGLSELQEEEASDAETYISSKVYVGADGKIAAREFSLEGDEQNETHISWKNPSDGDKSGFSIEVVSNTAPVEIEGTEETIGGTSSSFSIAGTGETVDGVLNGEYMLAIDGVDMATITVADYNLEDSEAGYPNGSVILSLAMSDSADAGSFLGNLELALNFISDVDAEDSKIELAVNAGGMQLASLTMGARLGDGVEIPDFSTLSPVYDATVEEDVEAYNQAVNVDVLKENAVNAGVPEEFISMLETLMTAEAYEETAPEMGDASGLDENAADVEVSPEAN